LDIDDDGDGDAGLDIDDDGMVIQAWISMMMVW